MKWRKRLERAIKAGSQLTESEKELMEEDADQWPHCYIGENQKILKSLGFWFDGNAPVDNGLEELGLDFFYHVEAGEYKKALKIADKIDRIIEKAKAKKKKGSRT